MVFKIPSRMIRVMKKDCEEIKKSGGAGIGINQKTMGNIPFLEKSGAESGALEVLQRWPHLTTPQREAIVRIVREGL